MCCMVIDIWWPHDHKQLWWHAWSWRTASQEEEMSIQPWHSRLASCFFWTKLYIFLWMKWNEIQYIWVFFLQMWRPHFIHDEPLEYDWDWGNLGNSMVHFGAPNGRWNWTDSSLRDGIRIHRWLLDDKTHKGCHGSVKKGVNSPLAPLWRWPVYGMYGMYGCFISVGVSILGEDVIISFLVKHLDFSSLPCCLARSSSSVLENHPFFVYTPGVYTCLHPFSN